MRTDGRDECRVQVADRGAEHTNEVVRLSEPRRDKVVPTRALGHLAFSSSVAVSGGGADCSLAGSTAKSGTFKRRYL
jgi:hypothetical protein